MGKQLNVENSVISAKDDAFFYNAMIQKNGVWQYGNKLDYEIISANQINIKDGMVTAQGRNYVIYPNEVDSLTIENGTVNTKRNDLIVYEVSKTSEGEQVGLKVIKGTNATTPTDPTLTQDDTLASGSKYQMPLYRVRLNGINIEGVDDLREYIVSFGNLVNDNLLINSDFRNPVNQRGETSYSGNGIYTIDRWKTITETGNGSNIIVTVNSGYIKIENTGDSYDIFLNQTLDNVLEKNNYTMSVNVKSVSGTAYMYCSDSNKVRQGQFELMTGNNNNTILSDVKSLNILLSPNSSIELYWIKLEKGSVATPFVPRHYGEELALCQRYLFPIARWEGTYTERGDNLYYTMFVPNLIMRTNPTATEAPTAQIIGFTNSGTVIPAQGVSNFSACYQRKNGIEIAFNIDGTSGINFGLGCFIKDFFLDAEIY